MTRTEDVAVKRERMQEFMKANGLGGVLFTRQDAFAWYTGGGYNHVGIATEAGAAALLATPEKDYLIANAIERPRIMDEELEGLGVEPVEFPWDADASEPVAQAEKILGGAKLATDSGEFAGAIKSLRYSLTPYEVEQFKALGKDTGIALAEVCRAVQPGQTEWDVVALMSEAMWKRQIIPVVGLVAADERLSLYRHPIPTNKPIEKAFMLVVCTKRGGLIISSTRLVHFGPLSDELRKKHDAVMQVDATFITESVVGTPVKNVFTKALETYAATGFGEEWKLHHQGGGTGYATRDYKGTHGCTETVQPWQAFAWNPSITGTKSEDTIIATPDGPEIISMIGDWPTVEAPGISGKTVKRADILVR